MRWVLTAGFVSLAAGCAGQHATRDQLVRRAAFDLRCDTAQLEIVAIDERTAGVRGCSRQATYIESCEVGANQYGTYRTKCTWIMNTDTRPGN